MIPFRFQFIIGRLWSFLTFRYALILYLCLWSIDVQNSYRVPTRFLFLFLPWVTVSLTVLSFILLVDHLLILIPKDHLFRATLSRIEWGASLLVILFIGYSLLLYANGALDRSSPVDRPYEIVEMMGEGTDFIPSVFYVWARIRSNQESGRNEGLLLTYNEKEKLWAGESILAQTHEGYFHIPWISNLDRDEEKSSLEGVKIAPAASVIWIRLIYFYMDHRRWKEAVETTYKYLKVYPDDYMMADVVGGNLDVLGQYDDGIPLLEYAAAIRPTSETYAGIGWGLRYQGKSDRAAVALEKAIQLDPDNWWAYFHLGYVYRDLGRNAEAVKMFEKVLKYRSNFPMVQKDLAELRKKITADHSEESLRGGGTAVYDPNHGES